jgi:glycerophosphoryl diester phosphodiesterase
MTGPFWVRAALVCVVVALLCFEDTARSAEHKQLVAHRGASAYAPEHTLAAYRLAIEQGADFVEQDLAVTRDGVLICLHDDSLERTTNVEQVFPMRATPNGRTGRPEWLAVNFTLAEIKQLDAGSWFHSRFAGERIPTWAEAVAAVGTRAGLYPELKSPPLYRERGIDMVRLFVDSLEPLGLANRPRGSLILQSFDDVTVRQLARDLPAVPRTLLIAPHDAARWLSDAGLREAATFATDIGPAKTLIEGRADIVATAHKLGLTVTPYTFTARDEMMRHLYELGVDALFTDNPDLFPRREAR